jgi:hypothetical protein
MILFFYLIIFIPTNILFIVSKKDEFNYFNYFGLNLILDY